MKRNIAADLLASVVVFLVALPLCMGIAIASGVPPAMGLITGIVGGILVGTISGSPLLVSGPAAGLAIINLEIVQKYGLAGLGPVILAAGIIQMAAGITRMGMWFRAVSPAVIHGMLAGIGVTIMATQAYRMMDADAQGHGLKSLLLFPGTLEQKVLEPLMAGNLSPFADGPNHHLAFLIGAVTIAVMVIWPKVAPKPLQKFPGALMGVIVGSAAAQVFAPGDLINYVKLPASLTDAVVLADWQAMLSGTVITSALVVAFIASAETLLSAAAVDNMHDGPKTKYDKELFAQGVGNSICGFFGCLPMTGVIARSGANVAAGAKTRLSTILHGIWLLILVTTAGAMLEKIPISSLAAILVVVGFKLVNPEHIHHLKKYGRGEVAIYFLTLGVIVATNLLDGVLLGLGLAFAKVLHGLLRLDIRLRVNEQTREAELRLRGAATFIQLPKLAQSLERVPAGMKLHVKLDQLDYVDHACLELLGGWAKAYGEENLFIEWETLEKKYGRRRALTVQEHSAQFKIAAEKARSGGGSGGGDGGGGGREAIPPPPEQPGYRPQPPPPSPNGGGGRYRSHRAEAPEGGRGEHMQGLHPSMQGRHQVEDEGTEVRPSSWEPPPEARRPPRGRG